MSVKLTGPDVGPQKIPGVKFSNLVFFVLLDLKITMFSQFKSRVEIGKLEPNWWTNKPC